MCSGGAGREWKEESALVENWAAGIALRVCARSEWSGLDDESRRPSVRELRRLRVQ